MRASLTTDDDDEPTTNDTRRAPIALVKRRSRVFQRKTWRSRASMRAIARCCILEQFGVSTIPVKSMLSIPSRYGKVWEGMRVIIPI